MKNLVLGVDIGGTFIKGVIIAGDEVIYKTTVETNDHQDHWKLETTKIVQELSTRVNRSGIPVGLAAPGISDHSNRSIFCMPGRLDGLENLDWSDYLNLDVYVLNDAHAAMVAESRLGIAREVLNVIMLTLGTGVGGGLLVNGQLVQGFLQRSGHFGHITVDGDMYTPDNTGLPGTLEEAIGDETLLKRSLGKFSRSEDLVKAYEQGDTWATFVWLKSVQKLALGIVSLCNAISPEMVVLAGGITKAGSSLMEPLTTFLDLYEWRPGNQATPIRIAEFQDFAGAIGAALFARSKIETI